MVNLSVNLSTELACINFIQKLYDYLDNGEKVAGCILRYHRFAIFGNKTIQNRRKKRRNFFNWIMSYQI